MIVSTVEFEPKDVKKAHSKERELFRKNTDINNVLYLFFGDDKCYYIGETSVSLYDRCFVNTPKYSEKDWFDKCNKIVIIKLDDELGSIERTALESSFILAYKSAGHPLQNEK